MCGGVDAPVAGCFPLANDPASDAVVSLEAMVGGMLNSDGLRSILFTMSHIPNMIEKTLRYPGHVEYVKVLKESGFFSEEKINVKGVEVSPLDFTSKILFNE